MYGAKEKPKINYPSIKTKKKPTPAEEARWGLAVIEDSLWETIPKVLDMEHSLVLDAITFFLLSLL